MKNFQPINCKCRLRKCGLHFKIGATCSGRVNDFPQICRLALLYNKKTYRGFFFHGTVTCQYHFKEYRRYAKGNRLV